jgi:hypothetical protein
VIGRLRLDVAGLLFLDLVRGDFAECQRSSGMDGLNKWYALYATSLEEVRVMNRLDVWRKLISSDELDFANDANRSCGRVNTASQHWQNWVRNTSVVKKSANVVDNGYWTSEGRGAPEPSANVTRLTSLELEKKDTIAMKG